VPRLACLFVPDLPIAATCRADPELTGTPLVLSEGSGPHAPVVAVARAARARGILPGRHSLAQARAIAADIVVRPRNPAAERSAALALADVAASVASRIEVAADGAVFLEAAGARHLVKSEAGLATALVTRAARVGLEARAGVGASMTVARLAAETATDGVQVIPPGTERGFLAPLPLSYLSGVPTRSSDRVGCQAILERWGVRRLGDLARLPVAEVATRLGPAGEQLVRLARGEDERPLAPQALTGRIEEAIGLEYAIDTLEPLLFVLRGLIERAVARVGLDGIGCARLGLHLALDDRSRDQREVVLAAPTRDVKTLLTCVRVELEARPPRAAVTQVTLSALPDIVRATQLGLFHPPGPAPERLATTLARLAALCGADRVGAPAVVDTHRPGAAAVAPFVVPPATEPLPACRSIPLLVVRAFRPPRAVEVFCDRDRPDFVRGMGLGGRVVAAAGPWRVLAEWWSETGCARDYYDLELSDGALYRCYREAGSGAWFVDGVYD
jgi:protein ImuB